MNGLVRVGVVRQAARANWGRWLVDCVRCDNAMMAEPFITDLLTCRICDATLEVVWPDGDMVDGVERLLMMRPDPKTRNWLPGETLSQLAWENGQHGVFDDLSVLGLAPAVGQSVLTVTDDRIRTDRLPAIPNRIRRAIAS